MSIINIFPTSLILTNPNLGIREYVDKMWAHWQNVDLSMGEMKRIWWFEGNLWGLLGNFLIKCWGGHFVANILIICGEHVDFSQRIPHIFSVQQFTTSTKECWCLGSSILFGKVLWGWLAQFQNKVIPQCRYGSRLGLIYEGSQSLTCCL